jgi:hypothetical protein
MTKEQEKAIEYFNKHIKYFEEQIKFIEATDCNYYDEELELYQNRVKQFKTILSMLEEKDKQIERCIKLLVTNDMLHAIECENKDKIIDEMAKVINEAYFESEDFEKWFENKICKVQMYEDYTYLEKNIKRYFENKAKELLNK